MLRLLFPANRSLRSGSIGSACSQKHLSAGRRRTVTPAAILDQMDWLVGQRRGMGIGDAPARESWLPSAGGTMVGTFVQENGKGGIQFTEHMYLLEEEGSLVLELKRFNADLTGWEEKDDKLTFPLKAIAPCFAEFGAVTFSCIAMGDPGRGLLITVKMKEGGKAGISPAALRYGNNRAVYGCLRRPEAGGMSDRPVRPHRRAEGKVLRSGYRKLHSTSRDNCHARLSGQA